MTGIGIARISWSKPSRSAPAVAFLFTLLLCASVTFAADGRLSVDLAASSPRVRSNAPLQMLLKVYWNGSSIIQGQFEMTYYTHGRVITSECISHDLVLSPGAQTIRLTLPTSGSNIALAQDQVGLKFVTADQTFDLERYPLFSRPGARSTSICLVGPTDRPHQSEPEEEITSSLRLSSLLARDVEVGSVSTVFTRWEKADLPEQAIHYCTFDMVVLTPEGLADLRSKQLDAILTWARAGGSVCAIISDDLDGHHVEFLNKLVAESVEAPFLLDTSGKFVAGDEGSEKGFWLSYLELGRAAVIDLERVPAQVDGLWHASRKMACFLWKLRKDQQQRALSISRKAADKAASTQGAAYRGSRRFDQVTWRPLPSSGQFINRLMPEEVQIVPMSLIGLVLFGYLLLIGPVDYYLLGFFQRRRYTWLTFPLTTVAVALLCVAVSDAYLSSKTTGKTLAIRDVDVDGNVLRETRFRMIFMSRSTNVTTEVSNEIFTPLDQERLTLSAHYAYQYQYAGQNTENHGRRAKYTGRIPVQYEVHQTIPQWRPQVNRFLALRPDSKVDGFDWNQDMRLRTERGRNVLRELVKDKWPNATAFVLHGAEQYQLCGPTVFSNPQLDERDYRYYPMRKRNEHRGPNSFLYSLCARKSNGMFQFVSQISPNGGDNFEDLTLLDTSDPSQALLIIAVEEGDDLVLYRRLFTELGK